MTAVWITIAGLFLVNLVLKAAGPVALGGRELPRWSEAVIGLLAPALLTALILVDTFGHEGELTVDARAVGLGCAGVSVLLRAPMLLTVLVAAAGTAAARAIS
jgi:branched-subunit amino acid transport protein